MKVSIVQYKSGEYAIRTGWFDYRYLNNNLTHTEDEYWWTESYRERYCMHETLRGARLRIEALIAFRKRGEEKPVVIETHKV